MAARAGCSGGYVARFRLHEGMDWNEVSLGPDKRGYLFEGLVCGSAYYFSILSYNRNGRSEPGELLQVKTEGTVPQPPSHRTGIVPNVTGLNLALSTWRDGGCPISHFFIQYKSRDDSEWTLLSSRVLPDRDSVAIGDLMPGTWYNIVVMAFNSAGSTKAEYTTATLTLSGNPLLEPDKMAETGRESIPRYRSLSIIVPICCSIVVLMAVTVAIMVLLCRKRTLGTPPSAMDTYGGVRMCEDLKMDSLIMSELEKPGSGDVGGREYYPSPYASSKLPNISRRESADDGGGPRSDEHGRVMSAGVSMSPYASSRMVEHTYDVPQHPREGTSRRQKRLYQLEKKFGFFTEPVEATTEKEWESVVRKRVREQENVQWLEAARTKSTLTMCWVAPYVSSPYPSEDPFGKPHSKTTICRRGKAPGKPASPRTTPELGPLPDKAKNLPKPTMSSTAQPTENPQAAPSYVFLPVVPRVPTPFHSEIYDDVEDWLQHYERVAHYNAWTTEQRLQNIFFALEGTARQWFENHEASLTTWKT
ncbi:hypothetical protein HPB47_009319 [Ixodes persulcatus]|uniref:Uncharacterized protein n=1 Tax=Ixodes persulcatus TaxID=34615 RepID=A0AC60P276_IXOPE|nr:hypothetical protein HPB47_009319 [Ixodes persulcatus]